MIENIRLHTPAGDGADQAARLPQLGGGDLKIAGFNVADRFRKLCERLPEQGRVAGVDRHFRFRRMRVVHRRGGEGVEQGIQSGAG